MLNKTQHRFEMKTKERNPSIESFTAPWLSNKGMFIEDDGSHRWRGTIEAPTKELLDRRYGQLQEYFDQYHGGLIHTDLIDIPNATGSGGDLFSKRNRPEKVMTQDGQSPFMMQMNRAVAEAESEIPENAMTQAEALRHKWSEKPPVLSEEGFPENVSARQHEDNLKMAELNEGRAFEEHLLPSTPTKDQRHAGQDAPTAAKSSDLDAGQPSAAKPSPEALKRSRQLKAVSGKLETNLDELALELARDKVFETFEKRKTRIRNALASLWDEAYQAGSEAEVETAHRNGVSYGVGYVDGDADAHETFKAEREKVVALSVALADARQEQVEKVRALKSDNEYLVAVIAKDTGRINTLEDQVEKVEADNLVMKKALAIDVDLVNKLDEKLSTHKAFAKRITDHRPPYGSKLAKVITEAKALLKDGEAG